MIDEWKTIVMNEIDENSDPSQDDNLNYSQ